MLERIWTNLLELTAQFVTPDWGKIIAFLPILFVVIVVALLLWVFRRLVKAPPARRGKQRIPSKTPAGVHMPGPSFSPAFAAMGTFLILLGLVFGGITLVLGALALALTLLYWLAEGLRIYDHDNGPTGTTLPAVIDAGPPPGVHMPGPSWRPILGAVGVFLLLLGLVFGGWLLAVGVIALIATLVGWLTDAVQEYRRTVEADTTGHLESGPAPRTPSRLLAALTILTLGAAILQSSVFATGPANGGTGTAGASGAPPASGAPAAVGGTAGIRRAGGFGRARERRAASRRRRGRDRRGQGHRLRPVELDGTGRQAVHDRLRERGRGHAAQHRADQRVGDGRLQGRHLQRRRDPDLRRHGTAGRRIHLQVHRPSEHDRDGHAPVVGRRPCRVDRSCSRCSSPR